MTHIEFNGLEEKEIKNVSGKIIQFTKFEVPSQNSNDFALRYDVRNAQNPIASDGNHIGHVVTNMQNDLSKAIIENVQPVSIPHDGKIYIRLDFSNNKSFSGKSFLYYETVS